MADFNIVGDFSHIKYDRCSKDKTINSQGKTLLKIVENLGGIFLNGRILGDLEGEYSFCGGMGSSVIDYCMCSPSLLQYIDKFAIRPKSFSDHIPLCLEIKVPNSHSVV